MDNFQFSVFKELQNYETIIFTFPHSHIFTFLRGQGWIRTTELVRGQIYSLLPLATWLLARFRKYAGSISSSISDKYLEPLVGIEPTTYWLQISCSTSWAKVATFHLRPSGFSPGSSSIQAIKNYPHLIGEAKVREFEYWKNFEEGNLSWKSVNKKRTPVLFGTGALF